jgi:adenosylcobinamide-GDP ribazoletransferase
MSKSNAIKTFRDLLAFLTIIPLGQTEDFVEASARNIFLFPVVGALIGVFAAGYFFASGWIVSLLLLLVNFVVHVPSAFLQSLIPAAMTLAFLLIITGFQHFDGLVDLGNALGLKRVEDRREIAHRWVVTYKGALLALIVEFSAVVGLLLVNLNLAVKALIVAEVCAKLAMVTIVWRGKASHEGLGARFIRNAKRKLNVAGYAVSFLIGFALLGLAGLLVVLVAVGFGLFMEKVANSMFGGVSGDMIGATNETARAVTLVLVSAVSFLASVLFAGALLL